MKKFKRSYWSSHLNFAKSFNPFRLTSLKKLETAKSVSSIIRASLIKIPESERFLCKDCGVDTCNDQNYYMVKPKLWNKYGVGRYMLCRSCFEKRLGRTIKSKDLTDCRLNETFKKWI